MSGNVEYIDYNEYLLENRVKIAENKTRQYEELLRRYIRDIDSPNSDNHKRYMSFEALKESLELIKRQEKQFQGLLNLIDDGLFKTSRDYPLSSDYDVDGTNLDDILIDIYEGEKFDRKFLKRVEEVQKELDAARENYNLEVSEKKKIFQNALFSCWQCYIPYIEKERLLNQTIRQMNIEYDWDKDFAHVDLKLLFKNFRCNLENSLHNERY